MAVLVETFLRYNNGESTQDFRYHDYSVTPLQDIAVALHLKCL